MNILHRFEEVESKCNVDIGGVNKLVQGILIQSLDEMIQECFIQVRSITVPQGE
jgi:hypothetical protein